MLCPTQIKLTVKKYDYLHVYKLTTYLVSLIINNDAYISVLPISPGGSGEHTYLPKKTGIFSVNIVRNEHIFVLQKRLGKMSSREKV